MKYLLMPIAAMMVVILFAFNTKDEVKSQIEHVKDVKVEKYIKYGIGEGDNGKYSYGRTEEYPLEVTEILPDKILPKHKMVIIKEGNKMNHKPEEYIPDNMAFPVSYKKGGYRGNEERQKKYGYVHMYVREIAFFIFLDGLIYKVKIEDKEKNEIRVLNVYAPQEFVGKDSEDNDEDKKREKKKMSLRERMKALQNAVSTGLSDAGAKKLVEMNAVEKVQTYYKEAMAKQKAVYPEWAKSKEGAAYLSDMKSSGNTMDKAANEARVVTFTNKTGRDIYIYAGDTNRAGVLAAGASAKYICGLEYFYDYDGKRFYYPNNVTRILDSGDASKCGKTVEVK